MNSISPTTDTATHTTTPPFDGCLFVDLEGQRARYECLRPACPQRRTGPVTAVRDGLAAVTAFIADVKSRHLAQYHPGENTP